MNRLETGSKHFCLLAIGNPSTLGKLSLQSILDTAPKKVCVMVDELGEKWLSELTSVHENQICMHQILPVNSWVLKDTESDFKFESFGSAKFFRLMYLKWIILEECFAEQIQGSFLIFSDLDVLWNKFSERQLDDFSNSSSRFALQDDSTLTRQYYCPGIMVWKKSHDSIRVLNQIREFHLNALIDDPYLPDDKAINRWLAREENISYLYVLPKEEFVIGHRVYDLLRGDSGFSLSSFVAFHANYCIGSVEKLLRIRAVLKSQKFPPLRHYYVLVLIFFHFRRKIHT